MNMRQQARACCRLDWWWHSDIGAHPISLRFAVEETERGFVRGRTEHIAHVAVLWLCLQAFITALFTVVHVLNNTSAESTEHATLVTYVSCGLVGAALCLAVLVWVGLRRGWSLFGDSRNGFWRMEGFIVMGIIVFFVLFLTTDSWYLARLLGVDPWRASESSHHNDTHVLLMIDMFIALSHMLLPVRWCTIWPLELAGLCSYVVLAKGLGSAEAPGSVHQSFFLLAVLIFIGAWGKRRSEWHERKAFCGLITERTLRVRAERGSASSNHRFHQHSFNDSDSTVVDSGAEFDDVSGTLVGQKLARLARLGIQEHWLLNSEDVRLWPQKILGSGSFGKVVMGSLYGSPVAVKVPIDRGGLCNVAQLPQLVDELRVHRHMRHPNIVLFHGACIDANSCEVALVLEYLDGEPLDMTMQKPNFTDQARLIILFSIARALRYMHERDPVVVHGDLKPANIMVSRGVENFVVKLLDLGLSRLLTKTSQPLGGSLGWMAPELCQKTAVPPRSSADVFSFGCLMYFVIMKQGPFSSMTRAEIITAHRAKRRLPLVWSIDGISLMGRALTERCMDPLPLIRPTAREVMRVLDTWPQKLGVSSLTSPSLGTHHGTKPNGEEFDDSLLDWQVGMKILRSDSTDSLSTRTKRSGDYAFQTESKMLISGAGLRPLMTQLSPGMALEEDEEEEVAVAPAAFHDDSSLLDSRTPT